MKKAGGCVGITNGISLNEIFNANDTPSKERRKHKQTRFHILPWFHRRRLTLLSGLNMIRVMLYALKSYSCSGPARSPIRIKGPTIKDFTYS